MKNNQQNGNESTNERGMTIAEMVAEGLIDGTPVIGLDGWLKGPTREEREAMHKGAR